MYYIPYSCSKMPDALGPLRSPGLRAKSVDPSDRLSWSICTVARKRMSTEASQFCASSSSSNLELSPLKPWLRPQERAAVRETQTPKQNIQSV